MSALLLRLFQSDHFSLHLAVSYLRTYADSIGVTAYLVGRLREFPDAELEFYWPQLCHLLITRPTESVALENLILRRCEQSTHLAMLTLWYLQASLSDLSKTPTSPAFAICRRALNRVQSSIFSDHLPTSAATSATALGLDVVQKISENVRPATVGIGLVASAVAQPAVAFEMGPVALDQGRRTVDLSHGGGDQDSDDEAYASSSDEGEARIPETSPVNPRTPDRRPNGHAVRSHQEISFLPGRPLLPSEPDSLDVVASRATAPPASPRKPVLVSQSSSALSQSKRRGSQASPLVSRSVMAPARNSAIDLVSPPRKSAERSPSLSVSTARFPSPTMASAHPQSASVPVLPLGSMSRSSASFISAGTPDYVTLSRSLPRPLLVKLLRSYACRTQLDLLTSLQDISTRLILVPKPARISALRAELTVLNHRLPRGCCLCMGCPGENRHHRVVRISPSEAVVLNSADRAPFLLQVEVLEEDLDFEPARRQNAEDVRIVLEEREQAIARQSYRSAHPPPKRKPAEPLTAGEKFANAFSDSLGTAIRKMKTELSLDGDEPRSPSESLGSKKRDSRSRHISEGSHHTPYRSAFFPATSPPAPSQPHFDSLSPLATTSNEEVDLVEQLFGDVSMHDASPAFEVEDYMPPAIQNRSIDEAAWRRLSPAPSSTKLDSPRGILNGYEQPNGLGLGSSTETAEDRGSLTLDQYAERMRMAAVMLAQLSASQQPVIGLKGTATELVGAGVGLGAGLVGAALGRLPFAARSSSQMVPGGQAASGVAAKVDASHATSAGVDVGSPRQRILSPQDAAAIRERIMREMMELEQERMERMRLDSKARAGGWGAPSPTSPVHALPKSDRSELGGDDAQVVRNVVSKDDPSSLVLRESWTDKRARIRAASPYGHLAAWDLLSVIVKTGADLRQEQLTVQLIREFGRIWTETSCPHWIRYFRILVTSNSTGLIETITDAISVHSLKKVAYATITQAASPDQQPALTTYTLQDYFVETFGDVTSSAFRRAQDCFIKSLASYSVICYILQIKDRHNGNILIDKEGHIIHIDFGFLLSNSPGALGFEMAPFKLPQDYIDVLGGLGSEKFADYRKLVKQCFGEIRRHAERIIMLVELMQKDSNLPCFSSGEQTGQSLRERFQLGLTRSQCDEYVDRLIDSSALSVFTRLYDAFQSYSQGILS